MWLYYLHNYISFICFYFQLFYAIFSPLKFNHFICSRWFYAFYVCFLAMCPSLHFSRTIFFHFVTFCIFHSTLSRCFFLVLHRVELTPCRILLVQVLCSRYLVHNVFGHPNICFKYCHTGQNWLQVNSNEKVVQLQLVTFVKALDPKVPPCKILLWKPPK